MVDYSRFAHIGEGESDDEAPRQPRVTRLEQGATVSIGADGWRIADAPPQPPKRNGVRRPPRGGASTTTTTTKKGSAPAPTIHHDKGGKGGGGKLKDLSPRKPPARRHDALDYAKWDALVAEESDGEGEPNQYYEDDMFAEREAAAKRERAGHDNASPRPRSRPTPVDATLDGGIGRDRATGAVAFAWSQTADELTVRFATTATAAKDVDLDVSFDTTTRRCVVALGAWRATLKHDVWCRGDDRPTFRLAPSETDVDDWAGVLDWELERGAPTDLGGSSAACVRVTLKKRPPDVGVTVWWSRLFDETPLFDEADLDVSALGARLRRHAKEPKDRESLQDTWKAAHAAFLEKVRDHQPIAIDLPGSPNNGEPHGTAAPEDDDDDDDDKGDGDGETDDGTDQQLPC